MRLHRRVHNALTLACYTHKLINQINSQCKQHTAPTTWGISHFGFYTRSVLTFCALKTTKASNAMMNAGFYFESAWFWWWGFTSVNPTCYFLHATDRFLDQGGLKAVSPALSHTVFLISAASLLHSVLYPWLSLSSLCSVTFPNLSLLSHFEFFARTRH